MTRKGRWKVATAKAMVSGSRDIYPGIFSLVKNIMWSKCLIERDGRNVIYSLLLTAGYLSLLRVHLTGIQYLGRCQEWAWVGLNNRLNGVVQNKLPLRIIDDHGDDNLFIANYCSGLSWAIYLVVTVPTYVVVKATPTPQCLVWHWYGPYVWNKRNH